MKKNTDKQNMVLAQNKAAFHHYFVLQSIEAGLVLRGHEVKSIKEGKINLKEGYGRVKNKEIFLEGVHVEPYSHLGFAKSEVLRSKKLLLNKNEIQKIEDEVRLNKHALIPLKVYLKNGKIKVELGVCKGKKHYDKRETIKKKTQEREMQRR